MTGLRTFPVHAGGHLRLFFLRMLNAAASITSIAGRLIHSPGRKTGLRNILIRLSGIWGGMRRTKIFVLVSYFRKTGNMKPG